VKTGQRLEKTAVHIAQRLNTKCLKGKGKVWNEAAVLAQAGLVTKNRRSFYTLNF